MTSTHDDRLFIGLMSGTSLDGVDAALVRFTPHKRVLATNYRPFSEHERAQLRQLLKGAYLPVQWVEAGRLIARRYTEACLPLIKKAGGPEHIGAIGAHGQTLFHQPATKTTPAITVQCLDAFWLAEHTGVDVIFDFRQADVAAGGQGAPLVPPFHADWFGQPEQLQAVINIGGIANITLLNGHEIVCGYDIGPGNTLLDQWCQRHLGQPFDCDGQWADLGDCQNDWLDRLLADPYFSAPPPKSTGPEYFNLTWLAQKLPDIETRPPEDVQATLVALTAETIARASQPATRIILCGGGAHNAALRHEIRTRSQLPVVDSNDLGLDPDYVEAAAFAWLAYQYLLDQPANAPQVTGAQGTRILGAHIKRRSLLQG
ncbi:MAG: anhydro-N-acetylmuramic acid kinase [Gammaproteobacteria bacterium]|nr:MAG: anhydro-N-acetylmuramic acid kinase [Gammaproteobacteria bacterium]